MSVLIFRKGKGKNYCAAAVVERNSPAGTKVREKGGVTPSFGAELSLQPMQDPMLLQLWYKLFPEHINSN